MSTVAKACLILSVILLSASLGAQIPEGWLWALCALFIYVPEGYDSRADQMFQPLIWTHNAPVVKA